ncbi:MAG: aminotransferase class V-fold PLP-dependent enzyme [Gemmatimonadetes bacterium]|nr:aminotransferase class V-fold PLP-dependent enzyme [Gemmatimonadota bacterium]
MPNIYERIGVRPIINASGPSTRLSGGIMDPEVADAMREASQYCVDIAELQARASAVIAEITGAEAGYVTSGAAAGLLLGTAACVTGPDPGKMNRLPDTEGMKNEVIMSRSQRNFYDHAIRSVGVKLVEVGIADRYSGAGVRDTEAWEIADAITERTAAVCYVAHPRSLPPLEEVVEVAHARGVPVIVDAAGQLPPRSNLQAYISQGADLVAFSGGKAIGGPQGSGILCGRRDLIMCVALQHLDMDVLKPQWNPPESLIDKSILPGAPHHGIGRPCKVGKEQIVGLLTAMERFAGEHLDARAAAWRDRMVELVSATGAIPGGRFTIDTDSRPSEVPMAVLKLDESVAGKTALDVVLELQAGDPPIQVNTGRVSEGIVLFGPVCLKAGEPERVARRLKEILGD